MTTPAATAPAPAPAKTAARFSFGGGAPKCATCSKSVYANERTDYDGATFHVECFKCLKCKSRLTPRDVAKIAGDIYCKPCFKKVFAEKGRYDSFGDKTVAKWTTADQARKSSTGAPPAASSGSATGTPSVAPITEEAKAAPTPAAAEPVPAASPVAAEPVAEVSSPAAAEPEAVSPSAAEVTVTSPVSDPAVEALTAEVAAVAVEETPAVAPVEEATA